MKIKVRKVKKFFNLLAKIAIATLIALFLIVLFTKVIRLATIINVVIICSITCTLATWFVKKR